MVCSTTGVVKKSNGKEGQEVSFLNSVKWCYSYILFLFLGHGHNKWTQQMANEKRTLSLSLGLENNGPRTLRVSSSTLSSTMTVSGVYFEFATSDENSGVSNEFEHAGPQIRKVKSLRLPGYLYLAQVVSSEV